MTNSKGKKEAVRREKPTRTKVPGIVRMGKLTYSEGSNGERKKDEEARTA